MIIKIIIIIIINLNKCVVYQKPQIFFLLNIKYAEL